MGFLVRTKATKKGTWNAFVLLQQREDPCLPACFYFAGLLLVLSLHVDYIRYLSYRHYLLHTLLYCRRDTGEVVRVCVCAVKAILVRTVVERGNTCEAFAGNTTYLINNGNNQYQSKSPMAGSKSKVWEVRRVGGGTGTGTAAGTGTEMQRPMRSTWPVP